MTTDPFEFLWCYEPEDDDDEEHCNCLLLGTPEIVTPLHIEITNIIPDKTIRINAIEDATEANADTYHFKLAFRFYSIYYAKLSVRCQNNKALFLKLFIFLKPKPQRFKTFNRLLIPSTTALVVLCSK